MEELQARQEGAVRWLSLNRPKKKNALTIPLIGELITQVEAAARASEVRVLALTGEGGAFCTGADLSLAPEGEGSLIEMVAARLDTHFHRLILALRECEKPVVAVVDGAAAGYGLDLALACDVRLATETARFSELFVRRGLMPDGGGTYFLPRLVGLGRAMELMFLGDTVEPAEALRAGLINRVLGSREEASAYLARLAEAAPRAVAEIKRATYASLHGDLRAALAREKEGQLRLLQTSDFAEGVAALFEKRPPSFKGE